MRLIDKLMARLGYTKGNKVSEVMVPAWASTYGAYIPTGTEDYLNTYGSSTWVYACASIIASTAAGAGIKLYKKIKKGREVQLEEVDEHVMLDLFRYVNPFMTRFELFEYTHLCLELTGNAYWVLLNNALGVPGEIWPVNPALIKVVPDKYEYIRGYLMEVNGAKASFERDEVIHFKYPNPTNPGDTLSHYYGLGPVAAARLAITGDLYASRWNVNFFSNGARPDGHLTTEQRLTEEDARRLRAMWEESHKGVDKAHRVAVLGQGTKYHQVAINPKDMDFLAQRKFGRDEILAIFGVPASKLGIVEDVNRANAEANNYTFIKDVIQPKLRRMDERLNAFLTPKFDERLLCRHENIIPEDREQTRKDREAGWNKWLTINEIREEEGKPPVEGGDAIYLPLSLVPAGEPQAGNDGKAFVKLRATTREEVDARKKLRQRLEKVSDEDRWRKFVSRIDPQEKRFKRLLKKLFQEQENEVRARVREGQADIELILFDEDSWRERFADDAKPYITEAVKQAGEDAMQEVRLFEGEQKDLFDLFNPLVLDFIQNKVFKFARQVNSTTLDDLRKELQEGFENGESIPQIEDRVGKVFAMAKGYRTEMIARTEIVGSSNGGALLGYKQSGVVRRKRWVAALDERTRRGHREAADKYGAGGDPGPISLDDNFVLPYTGSSGPAPGQMGRAEDDINCRCTIAPVVD